METNLAEVYAHNPPDEAYARMTYRRVLGLALPITGENLLQTSVAAVDTLMVSRLGTAQVAGVGVSAELVFLLIAILTALSTGATVLVAQAIGGGQHEKANRLARQGVVWGLVIAVPLTLLGFFAARPIISLFGAEADVTGFATTYLHITTATVVFFLLTFLSGAVLRGAGDSRTPLYAAMAANVVNLFFSYTLIFGHLGLPRLGVAGSAWAAASARATSAAILLFFLLNGSRIVSIRGRDGWKPSRLVGKQIFRLGIPASAEEMLMSSAFMSMQAVVAILGTSALAAQQIGFTALSFAFMPGFGFGMASTALVGQSIGAGRLDDARRAGRIAAVSSATWMVVGGTACFIFARSLMKIFTDDPRVVTEGVHALRALAVGLPFWAVWFVFGGALRGSGDTRTPMMSSGIAVWSAVLVAYLAVGVFDQGLGSVWLALFPAAAAAGTFNFWWFGRRLERGVGSLMGSGVAPHG